jgi:hypothetical protein
MPFHHFPALPASRDALLCRMNAGRRGDSNDLISGGDDLSSRDLVPLHGKGNAVAIVNASLHFHRPGIGNSFNATLGNIFRLETRHRFDAHAPSTTMSTQVV